MRFLAPTIGVILFATQAVAQHSHGAGAVTETGQAQFAAISEIVSVLRDDPSTNWNDVNIDALRAHLVDMDNVTTRASVARSVNGNEIRFVVTGEGPTIASIQNMIPAHSPMLAADTGWQVTSSLIDNGAVMSVATTSDENRAQVLGLGFFGLLTLGAHHQHHHMMIASGHSPH